MAWTIPCSSSLDTSVERLRTPGRFKKKEDLIAEMLDCLKKLNGVDQVILGNVIQIQTSVVDIQRS